MHTETLPDGAGDDIVNDGTIFNPGFGGPTRFAPFTDADGQTVPVLYLGMTRHAAVYEALLGDQMPGSMVKSSAWEGRPVLSAIETTAPLTLVELHGPGTRSLGLRDADITHTYPTQYPRATRWAKWLHTHVRSAAGLVWRSHQNSDEVCVVLWEDRVPPGTLRPEASPGAPGPLPLSYGPGLDLVQLIAAETNIEVS